jgi:hypothetical protein
MMTVPEKCRESRRMGKSSNNMAQSDPRVVVCCHLKPRSIIFLLKANVDRPEEPWNTHPTVSRERDSRFDSLCEEREGGREGEEVEKT